ncbi:heterokaryon incompatibility protein-domain-containing protein [Xylaria telfairii]|nr:heterokaryon incompatibility protein-domain-containing protein [Xylaria telfairii]
MINLRALFHSPAPTDSPCGFSPSLALLEVSTSIAAEDKCTYELLLTSGEYVRIIIRVLEIVVRQEDLTLHLRSITLAECSRRYEALYQQVQLVRKIYTCSGNVPIWLGNNGVGFAQDCCGLLKSTREKSRALLRKYLGNLIYADLVKWDMTQYLPIFLWFTWVWILEEAGLAPRATGRHVWASLEYSCRSSLVEKWPCQGSYSKYRELTLQDHLHWFLHIGRHFRTTDPRDHAFACLGHLSTRDDTTGELLVHIDYKKSIINTYYEASCALAKTLELAVSCPVPQWHLAKNTWALGYSTHWYYAGRNNATPVFFLAVGHRLRTRGFVLDTIARILDSDFKTCNSDRSTPVVEQIWRDLAAHEGDGPRYGPGDRVDAFSSKNNGIATQHRESFKSLYAKFGCALESICTEGSKRFFCTQTGYYGITHSLILKGDLYYA